MVRNVLIRWNLGLASIVQGEPCLRVVKGNCALSQTSEPSSPFHDIENGAAWAETRMSVYNPRVYSAKPRASLKIGGGAPATRISSTEVDIGPACLRAWRY